MDCADCANGIERRVSKVKGVETSAVNFGASKLTVQLAPEADPASTQQQILRAVREAGYDASAVEDRRRRQSPSEALHAPKSDGQGHADEHGHEGHVHGQAEQTTSLQAVSDSRTADFQIEGMDCADCARGIERHVGKLDEISSCAVNFGASKLRVQYADGASPERARSRVLQAVADAGYGAVPASRDRVPEAEASTGAAPGWQIWRRNRKLRAAAVSGLFFVLAWLVERLQGQGVVPLIATVPSLFSEFGLETDRISLLPMLGYAVSIVTGGYYVARSGFYAVLRTRTLDINFLMTVAVLGAVAINQWAEGAAVVFLFALGEGLEALTMDRTRNSIRSLMDLSPRTATVRLPDGTREVMVEDLQIGDIIVVRPGERIAMDGAVTSGTSTVNQAAITGESMPVEKVEGDEVFAGTINERGYLEVRVSKLVEDTTLAKIIHLVEEAQGQKAPSQRFVDQFAKYYTPVVIAVAVLLALVPSLFFAQPFVEWFYRALVLLVVSCPCALVISTPVSIVAAIGNASRNGALIKGGAYLEQAGSLRVVAFDKTGTLTEGRPEVTDVLTLNGYEPEELVALAAVIEERSEHPLAAAILRRRSHDLENATCEIHDDHAHDHSESHVHLYPHDESEAESAAQEVAEFEAITGRGARASLNGIDCYVGSGRLFQDLGVDTSALEETVLRWQSEGKTALLVGSERKVFGAIAVADRERPGARQTIAGLRDAGIRRVIMLTGDNMRTAEAVAARLGVDEYRADLLPADKVAAMQELMREYHRVAMVGDGVNDAPALATATVGVAMGAAGSDTALETADIALMADDLSRLPYVMGLSRRALNIIKANIAFALLVKAVFLVLTLVGAANLWMAILADTGASLIVIANGMRLMRNSTAGGERNEA